VAVGSRCPHTVQVLRSLTISASEAGRWLPQHPRTDTDTDHVGITRPCDWDETQSSSVTSLGHHPACASASGALLTNDWVPPQSHGALMPAVLCTCICICILHLLQVCVLQLCTALHLSTASSCCSTCIACLTTPCHVVMTAAVIRTPPRPSSDAPVAQCLLPHLPLLQSPATLVKATTQSLAPAPHALLDRFPWVVRRPACPAQQAPPQPPTAHHV
jgi:hypothetical protein